MAQEPRSFFQRLTGARLISPGEGGRPSIIDEGRDQPIDLEHTSSQVPPEEVIEEPAIDEESVYSDEDTGDTQDQQEGQLTVDVFQDDQNIIIQSTIAGVAPEDLDVSITNDMVTIRGERRRQYNIDPEDYFYQECYWGPFSRTIILPVEIDADRAEAKIKNGVMTVRIPKANAAVTRKLKVLSSLSKKNTSRLYCLHAVGIFNHFMWGSLTYPDCLCRQNRCALCTHSPRHCSQKF